MATRSDKMADAAHAAQSSFPLHSTLGIIGTNLELQLRGSGESMYVPVWSGRPGMGKTSIIKVLAHKMGLDLLYTSMYRPYEYFTGLPDIHRKDEEGSHPYVLWSEPELIHKANEMAKAAVKAGKRGCLIFLDDLHISSPDVQKVFFELILERTLGNFKLADNCAIMGAMNNSTQAGFEGFFSAINNRIQLIPVHMDFDFWYENVAVSLNEFVTGFLRAHKDGDFLEAERTDAPFATHRSWTILSRMMEPIVREYKSTKDIDVLMNKAYMLACTFMGRPLALNFKKHVGLQARYDFESMVKNGKYVLDRKDPLAPYMFANVMRYLTTEKNVDQLVQFVEGEFTKADGVELDGLVISIMYEARALLTVFNRRTDEDGKKRANIYNMLTHNMFRSKVSKVTEIVGSFRRGQFREIGK